MAEGVLEGTSSRLRNLVRSIVHHLPGDGGELPVEGSLPSFTGATSWLNADPLTPEELRGRVVLVDFWTYTCVNWLRTLPDFGAPSAKCKARMRPHVRGGEVDPFAGPSAEWMRISPSQGLPRGRRTAAKALRPTLCAGWRGPKGRSASPGCAFSAQRHRMA